MESLRSSMAFCIPPKELEIGPNRASVASISTIQTQCEEAGSIAMTKSQSDSLIQPHELIINQSSVRRHSNPDVTELDSLADQIEIMKEEVARLRLHTQLERQLDKTSSQSQAAQSHDHQRSTPHRSDTSATCRTTIRSPTLKRSQKSSVHTRETPRLPHFAQPTAATTRRVHETLHKAPNNAEKLTANKSTSIQSPTNRLASRLPKRSGLPDSWVVSASEHVQPDHSPVNLKTRLATPFTSPTKNETQAYKPSSKIDQTINTGSQNNSTSPLKKEDKFDIMAAAIAEVNAASRALLHADNTYDIHGVTITRRESTGDVLLPIIDRLEEEGLLRSKPAADGPLRRRKQSYADMLRRSFDAEPQGLTERLSSAPEDIIQVSQGTNISTSKTFGSTSSGQDRVIIPSASSFTHTEQIEDDTTFAMGSKSPKCMSLGRSASSVSGHAMTLDGSYDTKAHEFTLPTISTLNATAANFTPGNRTGDPYPPIPMSTKAEDDVFDVIPDYIWQEMSKEQRMQIRMRRRQKMYEYFSPLGWRRNQMLARLMERNRMSRQGDQTPTQYKASTASPEDSFKTPSSYTWSPDQRPGWRVADTSSGGPSWSGGNGREIRFTSYAPDAERAQSQKSYTYRNRDTGTMKHLDRTDDYFDLDNLDRLQAAMQRGYNKVPCGEYDFGTHHFAIMPSLCQFCASHLAQHQVY